MEKKKKVLAFLGSYADSSGPGLYACRFDTETGSLEIVDQADGLQNPTFLDVDPAGKKLYAITEGTDSSGQRRGAAAAFHFDPASVKLTLVNKENTVPAPTCHITLDHSRQCVIVSSYHGGMIGLSPLLEDGSIGATTDIHQHRGSSILPVQNQPRAHSVFLDRSNRFAVASDLGLDRILIYRLDLPSQRLIPHGKSGLRPDPVRGTLPFIRHCLTAT